MKHLVFVSGLQYSGKTSFCNKLELINDKKYFHIELDKSFDYLTFHRDVFVNIIKDKDRELYNKIRKLAKKASAETDEKVETKHDQITLFANYLFSQGKQREFQMLQSGCAIVYATRRIKSFNNGEVPLIDGVLINRFSRKVDYAALQESCNIPNLDEIQKTIVHFNLGLEESLKRYGEGKRVEKKSMICTEDTIKRYYDSQEIPSNDEFPNLEVLLIKREKDIDPCMRRILSKTEG